MTREWSERIPLGVSLRDRGFEKLASKNGVGVYRHRRDSPVRMVGEAWIARPATVLRDALINFPRHPGVINRLAEIDVLDEGPGWARVYHRLELPILNNRDFVLDIKWGHDDGLLWIEHRSVDVATVARPGTVRMPLNQGSWQLQPHDGGRTFARCQACFVMGGHIPRWITRLGAPGELPGFFACVDRLVEVCERAKVVPAAAAAG